MCDLLPELRQSLSRYAAGFDAAVLSAEQAAAVVTTATAVERMAGVIKAKAAARVAKSRAWKGAGERSAASHLARSTGSSTSDAAKTLETGRRLKDLPALDAAARSGDLSAEQTAAIADAAAAEPSAESRLVAKAKDSSLAELRAECARTKANACPDLEARRKKIHADRFLRDWTDGEGAWHLRMMHNPEVGAQVMAALSPLRDRLFEAARKEGRREPLEAYAADALVEAVCGTGDEADEPASRSQARAKVIARVDLPALLRGYPVGDETCEIAGFGPVAVSAIRDLIDTLDPFLAAVATSGEAVVGVAHLGRRPRAAQQTALEWLYPTCAVEGCTTTAFLENDTGSTGPTATSRCSTCSIDCAAFITTARRSTGGRWSRAGASGRSWHPTTRGILDIGRRHKPTTRRPRHEVRPRRPPARSSGGASCGR